MDKRTSLPWCILEYQCVTYIETYTEENTKCVLGHKQMQIVKYTCTHKEISYSYTVWDMLASRLVGRRINPDWHDMLSFIQAGTSNKMDMILIRLVFQAVVYHVWRERNTRNHLQGHKSIEQIIKAINKVVKT